MKIPFATAALVACAAFSTAGLAHAAPGDLDPTFGGDGKATIFFVGDNNDYATSVAIQSDGKIVVAGSAGNGGNHDFALARLLADGSLDSSFGSSGKRRIDFSNNNDFANSVAIQSDGKILVAGSAWKDSNTGDNFALARRTDVGDTDNSFGGIGKLTTDFAAGNDGCNSIAIQSGGNILVAGYAWNGSSYDFALARYTDVGASDDGFGVNGKLTSDFESHGDDKATSIAIQSNGDIWVAGSAWDDDVNTGANYNFALARYTADGGANGMLTTDFESGDDGATSIAIQSDGKVLVAGYASNGTNTDFALARYLDDGNLDPSFGPDHNGKLTTDFGAGDEKATSIAIQSDGKVLVAGYAWNGSTDFALARYTANGTLDPTFGGGDGMLTTDFASGGDFATSVAIQSDGKILVAGYTWNGSNYDFALARYLVDGTATAPPTVKVAGKKKLTTTKASVRLKGTTSGSVTSVAVKVGKKTVKAAGTSAWSAKLKLKPGKNKVAITATGPGGASAPAKVTITRK